MTTLKRLELFVLRVMVVQKYQQCNSGHQDMAELLRVLEHTRALNCALSVERLARILKIFRTWINVQGVEGGFALTRDELECVLEYPSDTRSVDFLFETFQVQRLQRVDLLTLLTAAALLCQGSLEEKAKFVFALVDLDTEDDIVEEELALVISTCSNGLQRLGVHSESLLELDALAIAYEAFEFAGVEDGGKMSFTAFLKWCVFHERPQALFERISYLFSLSNVIAMLQQALAQQTGVSLLDPFRQYNVAHFENQDQEAEKVVVVVGPIVKKVSSSSITVLLEVDHSVTVECFAFEVGAKAKAPPLGVLVRPELLAYEPQAVAITGLQPGTTYAIRLLGVRRADREQCIAYVTTPHQPESTLVRGNEKDERVALKWSIRALNHDCDSPTSALTQFEQTVYASAAHAGYESSACSMLSLHVNCFRIPPEKLSAMTKLLEANREDAADVVSELLKQCYRKLLSRPELVRLLRYQANLFFDRNDEVLFGTQGSGPQMSAINMVRSRLSELGYPIWKRYLGSLWGATGDCDSDQQCIALEGLLLLTPLTLDSSLDPLESETQLIADLKVALEGYPDVESIVLTTGAPIITPSAQNLISEPSTRYYRRLMDELLAWKRSALSRSVLLLSFAPTFGLHSTLSIKDTTITITQCVCGPLSGARGGRDTDSQPILLLQEQTQEKLVVRHRKIETGPHFVSIAASFDIHERKVKAVATIEALHKNQRHINVLVGPVVGWVSARAAQILLECDEEGCVTCVFIDRITGKKVATQFQSKCCQPVIFVIQDLRPGRLYDVSFQGLHRSHGGSIGNGSISAIVQTPYDPAPSWTLVVVADDSLFDRKVATGATIESSGLPETNSCVSFVGNIATHVLPSTRGMSADITLHIGNAFCLAHELTGVYNLYQQQQRSPSQSFRANDSDRDQRGHHYKELIRQCVRRHWGAIPENRELLSRGAHVFSSLGLLRSLLSVKNDRENTGVPLDFLSQVRRVVREYEAVGTAGIDVSSLPAEQFLTRLQHDGVLLLTLDTLENIVNPPLEGSASTQFAQLQANILTPSQWRAVERLLVDNETPQVDVELLVILCDVPLVWQDTEVHASAIWDKQPRFDNVGNNDNNNCGAGPANAWSLYPQELDRLLQLLFRKKQQEPAFHATVLCSGSHARRTTIREMQTDLELEQIVVGPISLSSATSERPPLLSGTLLDGRYSYTHHFPATPATATQQQYCVVDLVAHPQGSTSATRFLLQHQPEARVLLGPIIGRVTPRSARVLVELDRPADKCVCVLTDTASGQRFASELSVEAFSPTVFKMEGLRPGSRYAVSFEGVLNNSEASVLGYVQTPALSPMTLEWVVVQHNLMINFLREPHNNVHHQQHHKPSKTTSERERWSHLLLPGMRAYSAHVSAAAYTRNGDTLGDAMDVDNAAFNPWFYVEEAFLSEPMRNPQLVVHLGGQVDLSRAFSDLELLALIQRLGRENGSQASDTQDFMDDVRHRIQEVYRLTWGVPPLRQMLGYASNLMLLDNESDLFFSVEQLKSAMARSKNSSSKDEVLRDLSDTTIAAAANALRAIAFEFWQRYQNQLWVDVNERDVVLNGVKNSTKFAFSSTSGICRTVFMNLTQEVHDLRALHPVIAPSDGNKSPKRKLVPHSSAAAAKESSSLVETVKDEPAPLNLFSNATWKTLEDALLSSPATATGSTSSSSIQQLVVVIPADFVAWAKKFPQLRPDMVRVFEKCFAWKLENRKHRRVMIICISDRDENGGGSSLSFDVTDEKLNEKLTLSSIGSISEPREILHSEKTLKNKTTTDSGGVARKKKATMSQGSSGTPLVKGFFSKRYTYQSTLSLAPTTSQQPKVKSQVVDDDASLSTAQQNLTISNLSLAKVASAASNSQGEHTASRTFASFQFLSDYRSGFLNESLHYFPPRASPKATLGPVLGRISVNELAAEDPLDPPQRTASVRILLEINASARVACIVTDSLANEELRLVHELVRDAPHVFCIDGLRLERRYMYRFEGIYNASTRRGCFHTPCASMRAINFIALSSNFPDQVDPAQESLWVAVLERVRVPWCGIDAIIHLGGQVPLHEAAVQCFQWLQRELKQRRGGVEQVITEKLRHKVRKRFQQHYHLAWNLPHIREILACVSNWFLPAQADIAPFLHNQLQLRTKAAQVVLDVAKEVVADYQLALMYQPLEASVVQAISQPQELGAPAATMRTSSTTQAATSPVTKPRIIEQTPSGQQRIPVSSPEGDNNIHNTTVPLEQIKSDVSPESATSGGEPEVSPLDSNPTFVQTGEIGFFFCDMRSVSADGGERITCNNRLPKPLSAQEHPIIGENQWLQLESALKKKKVLMFVLCMELPLIFTSAEYVNQVRDKLQVANASNNNNNLSLTDQQEQQEEASGSWRLYDHKYLFQHWVACKRQLEQLLGLLFRWKTRRSGRDVLILSGGVKIGLDTLISETIGPPNNSRLSLRNLTCGPITAGPEPFEFPLGGVACPTFSGGGGSKDDRFTFSHKVVATNNFVLAQVAVAPNPFQATSDSQVDQALSATVEAEFVLCDSQQQHRDLRKQLRKVTPQQSVEEFRRFPAWWCTYIPMGIAVFWDDTISLKAASDDEMRALHAFVYDERALSAAIEVFYEMYQFAETARMEELRSRPAARGAKQQQHQRFDLETNLRAVFAELWKVIPEAKRQRIACFLDPFVFEFLLSFVAPNLLEKCRNGDDDEEQAIELEFFGNLCRDFVFNACVLHLAVRTQESDAEAVRVVTKLALRERLVREREDHEREETELVLEQNRLQLLMHSDPEQYAKILLAKESAIQQAKLDRKQEKLERNKAERVRELEEARAIAKEQKKLDKLAESGDPEEYARRQLLLETRVRKLEEKKQQRAAEKARKLQQDGNAKVT